MAAPEFPMMKIIWRFTSFVKEFSFSEKYFSEAIKMHSYVKNCEECFKSLQFSMDGFKKSVEKYERVGQKDFCVHINYSRPEKIWKSYATSDVLNTPIESMAH